MIGWCLAFDMDGGQSEVLNVLNVHKLNTKYITSSRNTTKFIVLCCTICYTTTSFGPIAETARIVQHKKSHPRL